MWSPVGRRGTGDPFAGPQTGTLRHLLDSRPVRGAQDELVCPLVVEVDEAGLGAKSVGDLAGDEVEHLFEVERRVDGGDRLGEEAQVTRSYVHRDS